MPKDKQDTTPQEEPQVGDPMMAQLNAMVAFEDRRFLVQTVAVGKKDAEGMRELTFPVSPMKQVTLVLAPELQEHIMRQFAGGIEVADLADLADLAAAAAQAEQAKQAESPSDG